MGEPLCQEKLPGEMKKPLRITLTLTTKQGDAGSLDPLWQALLSRRMFEIARRYRASSREKSFTIVSDTADLSISFPNQGDSAKTFASGCVIGSIAGLALFALKATPVLWVPVMAVLSGFAGILISRSASTDATVRADLPDIIVVSDALASWLSVGSGRKVRLEIWDRVGLEVEARNPEDVQSMFKSAVAAQEQGLGSAGSEI
jgi:hypothetical protein